jgi:cytochrome oxidase Cu insertion factor (SCO1/SenC/PrrC family)
MRIPVGAALCLAAIAGAPAAQAQAGPQGPIPAVGDVAPDFELTGATRSGQLADPVRLSDYRGTTVVLAFFYRARTPG